MSEHEFGFKESQQRSYTAPQKTLQEKRLETPAQRLITEVLIILEKNAGQSDEVLYRARGILSDIKEEVLVKRNKDALAASVLFMISYGKINKSNIEKFTEKGVFPEVKIFDVIRYVTMLTEMK